MVFEAPEEEHLHGVQQGKGSTDQLLLFASASSGFGRWVDAFVSGDILKAGRHTIPCQIEETALAREKLKGSPEVRTN